MLLGGRKGTGTPWERGQLQPAGPRSACREQGLERGKSCTSLPGRARAGAQASGLSDGPGGWSGSEGRPRTGAPGPASLHPALHGMGGAEGKQTAASGTTSGKAAARGHSPPGPAHAAMLAGSSAGAHAQAHTVHAEARGPHPDGGPPRPRGRHRHSWSWAGAARKHQWFLQRFPFLSFCFHFSSDVVFFF